MGRSDKSGFKKDNKFFHKKPRHEGEWNWGQGSPTKDKLKQFQGSRFKPKGNFVKKGAPFKASQPRGDFRVKPKGACCNCNEVGHYSKYCPKSKSGSGSSKVLALNANLAQPECNQLIFLKGKIVKRDVTTPLWAKCEGEAHTPKSGKLKSHRIPENSEDNLRGQISSH